MVKKGSSGPPYGESPETVRLQQEVQQLRACVEEMIRAQGLECILEHGFAELAKRLEPLGAIAPPHADLDAVASQKLRALRHTHVRPDFSSVPPAPGRDGYDDDQRQQGGSPDGRPEIVGLSLNPGTTPSGRSRS